MKKIVGTKDNRLVVNKEVLAMAQKALATQVITNSNDFVPFDVGNLRKSGDIVEGSDDKQITWATVYARRLYYGKDFKFNLGNNRKATYKWVEAAKRRYLKAWEQLCMKKLAG